MGVLLECVLHLLITSTSSSSREKVSVAEFGREDRSRQPRGRHRQPQPSSLLPRPNRTTTITCLYYIFFTSLLMYLFRQHGKLHNNGIHLVWALLIVVGITSAYFHATLSIVGQILDELSILWVVLAGTVLWFPQKMLPKVFKSNRKLFVQCIVLFGVIGTGLACVQPAFNAFALMTFGLPASILLLTQVKGSNNSRVLRLGVRCGATWVLAVVCWINDRLLCDMWSTVSFPYFHAIWHILIFSASYPACVLFAYFHAKTETPEKRPCLMYWPIESFEYGVPFVRFLDKNAEKANKKI